MVNNKVGQKNEGLFWGENSAQLESGIHSLHRAKLSLVGMI